VQIRNQETPLLTASPPDWFAWFLLNSMIVLAKMLDDNLATSAPPAACNALFPLTNTSQQSSVLESHTMPIKSILPIEGSITYINNHQATTYIQLQPGELTSRVHKLQ
jgi:hypothetical protein